MSQQKNGIPERLTLSGKRLMLLGGIVAGVFVLWCLTHFLWHKKEPYNQHALSLPSVDAAEGSAEKPEPSKWNIVTAKPGDTLGLIFKRLGLSAQTLTQILQNNPQAKLLSSIKPNKEIKFLIEDNRLEKLVMPYSDAQFLLVYRDKNKYRTVKKTRKLHMHHQYVSATIHGSLFGTAKRMGIPYKLMNQMTDIFNWEIDFAKDVRTDDQFTIIYKAYYINDKLVKTGPITAVSYTNRGKVYSALRHVNALGEADYYTPEGRSLKKAFSRYPLKFSHISSTFSLSRYHPLLHYRRAHKGIDLAARIGTPILAVGNGVIETIGRQNGYGNMIKIKHDKTFSTVYGHMLKFRKGLSRGSHVKRGQIIGYVGQSGLASGPHCHYELHINNQPRNPSTIPLPRSAPVSPKELYAFKKHSKVVLAHLQLFEDAKLASLHTKHHVG